MDSENENQLRIETLANNIALKIKDICPSAKVGLDISCQRGQITEKISAYTGIKFFRIEPDSNEVAYSSKKISVIQGYANNLPFPDSNILRSNCYFSH